MRNCKKRPRRPTRSQGRPSRDLFYQTLTDYSDEETQGILQFMKKLKQADDETCIFNRFCCGIDSYRYGCINYISLKNRLLWILRDHKGLLDEFHQLKSGFASPVIRNNEKKKENAESDMERTVGFLKKIEALGESVYKAFINAVAFSGDIEVLVEQLDEILRDHTPLKEDFETFLVDSRLLKRKREESVDDTPSYQIRPEAEVRSSSNGVFNEKYYLVSPYDPEVASQNEHQRCLNKKRNNLEDKLMKEDMLMGDLDAVIRFGKDPKLFEKPPLGFDRVLDWFCGGKEVPQKYKTHPKLAVTYMLPIMQITLEEMTRAKTVKAISANESEGEVK
ncbi:uncharacterized protein LOC117134009 [Brassica rapa]|uniref:Uncharacterized protein n=1 Tax=Brassica campestris TaxID=3711 RepID=M4EYK5_BRACM|nr:uncharacterized protein LOC117134009 [Brassica rapa]XP_033147289.1 uncharacterized protein LOC117134009 [Brassica rapa]XP_033147290.1 uncharacterized protein LOC117134009 [Brassica rapa]XP_033147291.1 uncharacterized protein LOC117134009 [Brassica rapa]XP_033147292.1 uncharacterized protein LOC117134009 [Brassica rapa]